MIVNTQGKMSAQSIMNYFQSVTGTDQLKKFLRSDPEGSAILESYQKTPELSEAQRSLLCRRVLAFLLPRNSNKYVSSL